MRWIVSLESAPTPARGPLLQRLAAELGLVAAGPRDPEQGPVAGPLDSLLTRMLGLAKVPAGCNALWTSSCLLDVPDDPVWRQLYGELASELVERLVPEGAAGTRHLMVCLDVNCDEAFESLFDGSCLPGNGCPLVRRESSLEDIARCCHKVASWPVDGATPFEVHRVSLSCPRFAADNPVAMDTLAASVSRACLGAMQPSRDPPGPRDPQP